METRKIKRSGLIARKRARRWKIVGIGFLILLALALLCFFAALLFFPVKEISFSESSHYTEEELEDLVFTNKACYNSIYLFWKYNIKKEEPDIPFIEKLEITVQSPSKVKVTAYEKGIVGYMEVLDSYVYFDKDGIVVEISSVLVENTLKVSGVSAKSVRIGKKLPLEDDAVFKILLNLTQLLDKHGVHPERVYFSEDNEMTLYFGEAKVNLGKDENMDEKIVRLKNIVPDIEEKKGTLNMENVDEDTKNITFTTE